MQEFTKSETIKLGLMLFALFFGAGNMIFPPVLGQAAGTSVWTAMLGFVITGVGLPLLGVVAVGLTGGKLQSLASRVHPVYGIVFTWIVYLAIGPFLGIPRTGTVAFEMGLLPFLPQGESDSGLPLFLYTLAYFAVTFWLCLNPSKLVDRIGKVLTPALLLIIAIVFVQAILNPVGGMGQPAEAYEAHPFIKGFLEGYLTLDALSALVFGIVVTSAIEERGITERRKLTWTTVKAGMIAVAGLGLVYLALGYLGATSVSLGASENGGQILTSLVQHLFGPVGLLLLGAAVTLACLTTSVGLVTASSRYFSEQMPKVSYKTVAAVLCLFSAAVANVGLTQLIAVSVPVLVAIYPLGIVLILLSFLHGIFKGYRTVYVAASICTAAVSLVDGAKMLGLPVEGLTSLYQNLPLYAEGIGWLVPAVVGALAGYIWAVLRREAYPAHKKALP
ncbi:branched-chain amino acid transport system II carrier protein [Brevibacillus sp. H7]|uniref:branched-chain amino acid transport system II carrier protein n=1 Tax=Brevibacillus sp. H7 TaxID=3349138 RepID=UPI003817D920